MAPKVINLDKFKTSQIVVIGDTEYTIGAIPIDMFLNDSLVAKVDNPQGIDIKTQIKNTMELIGRISNIPKKVLSGLQLPELTALLLIAQGVDPSAKEEGESKGPNA